MRHNIVGDGGLRDSWIDRQDDEGNVWIYGECQRCHEPVTIILEVLDADAVANKSSTDRGGEPAHGLHGSTEGDQS